MYFLYFLTSITHLKTLHKASFDTTRIYPFHHHPHLHHHHHQHWQTFRPKFGIIIIIKYLDDDSWLAFTIRAMMRLLLLLQSTAHTTTSTFKHNGCHHRRRRHTSLLHYYIYTNKGTIYIKKKNYYAIRVMRIFFYAMSLFDGWFFCVCMDGWRMKNYSWWGWIRICECIWKGILFKLNVVYLCTYL